MFPTLDDETTTIDELLGKDLVHLEGGLHCIFLTIFDGWMILHL
jgi:hypothetical protein